MATVITLPGRVDLPASVALRDQILSSSNDITIDASGVSMLGTPGLQVLLAARQHIDAAGKHISIDRPSPDFLACIADFGTDVSSLETKRSD